jgi:hypothetical protein
MILPRPFETDSFRSTPLKTVMKHSIRIYDGHFATVFFLISSFPVKPLRHFRLQKSERPKMGEERAEEEGEGYCNRKGGRRKKIQNMEAFSELFLITEPFVVD